ncbi:MAG TPA: ABC transporter permease [Actinoplanes sp.]
MITVIVAAVRARSAQAAMLLVLATIAAATAAAAPWYGLAVASRAAAAHVAAAPPAQRVLAAATTGNAGAAPRAALATFADLLHRRLPIGGAAPVLGMVRSTVYAPTPGSASGFPAVYRDGFCAHARLTGACPARAGEAAVSRDAARRTGLAVGDVFAVRAAPSTRPVRFRIVALYDPADPAGDYWADSRFAAEGGLDPFFTAVDSFADPQMGDPTLAAAVTVPARLLRGDGGYDLNAVLNEAVPRLRDAGVTLANPTGPLLDAVRTDRASILRAVLVALAQLVVLAWFAIGLTGRYTSRDRRVDAGQLKLRGGTRMRILRLTVGQHVVPLLGAALLALPAGVAMAWLLAGELPVAADARLALGLSAGAAAAVLIGCLLVLTIVDAAVLRRPVAALLSRVPPARRGWRRNATDVALIALAVGAAYQARAGGSDRGLGVAAPALVALGLAVLLARIFRGIADRAGAVAVRRGRLRVGLTAVGVSRQPGTDLVFVLLVVVVALLALAIGGYRSGEAGRADRSAFELGAARVLTVRAAGWTGLEYAVRQADPGGRQAMAAVVNRTSNPPVLAVDSSRLAAVAAWRPEYGPIRALPDTAAAASVPPPLPPFTGTALTLRVRNDRHTAVELDAMLQNEQTGAPVRAVFRPIRPGEQTVSAAVAGCSTGPGCRLDRWELVTPTGPEPGAVTVSSLAQQNPPGGLLGTAALGDVTRWHTDVTGVALQVAATSRGLSMSPGAGPGPAPGDTVYAVAAPLPLPVLLAGPAPASWRFDDPATFRIAPGAIPVRVVGTPRTLPVLGTAGMMVDLHAARLIAGDAEPGGTFQVWLGEHAPASIVDKLRAGGLTVVADDTIVARADRLARQGGIATARFGLGVVAAALLLAAAGVAIAAAVQYGPYLEQARALRAQGLPRRTAVVAGSAGTALLVLSGVVAGLIAAVVARVAAAVTAPPFADGWRILPPPDPLNGPALVVAGLIALATLGTAAVLSTLPLVRRLIGNGR